MLNIIKYPDPTLRKTTKAISDFNDDLKILANNMAETMYTDDGVGLAGPQVAISQQIIVIGTARDKYEVFINPEITFFSKEKSSGEEGCLSLPGIFGMVQRSKKIHLKYQDLDGSVHKEKIKGLKAVVVQHEVDHLNGILFIDRAEKITKGQEILKQLSNE